MKKSTAFRSIILLCVVIPLLFISSCQKEDQIFLDNNANINVESPHLKSVSTVYYLRNLISTIENLVEEGTLSRGQGNALISKIESAIKSSNKKNTNAAEGQLGALINQIEDLVNTGLLMMEQGESLIEVVEVGIAAIKGEPVIKDGLIAYYPFNGNVNDESGNNKNGEAVKITYTSNRDDNLNSAAYFNGEESLIKIPGIGQTNSSFSIAIWYKTNIGGTILRTDYIYMGADNTYNQFIASWVISIGTYSPAGNPAYFNDTWHHVVITHDSNEGRIVTYFDGVLRHDRPESGYFVGNNDDIYLGQFFKSYDFGFPYIESFYIGSLDDISFYNRALTLAEVELLYNYPN